ncbi:MAG: hypothetical protein LQ343_002952 [Gyalolechia ehrenbergii]|nr:MAG: hypothetical protein LQ343_002952 [Gyalolechia ehrenbergii]
MPTLGQYLFKLYDADTGCGASTSSNEGRSRFKRDPELSRKRMNVILLYRGAFNPPHRGHLALLWHAYTQLAKDLNIIAAIIHPATDERVRVKCRRYPPGERRFIPLRDRRRLWMEDPNLPPWAWVFEPIEGGRAGLEEKLKKLARKDKYRIRFADLLGPDCCKPDVEWNDLREMRIVSDIARKADFDHQDGLEHFRGRGFGPWVVDNGVMGSGSTYAETRDQMLDQWNELQRQKRIAAGEERARKAVAENYDSVLNMSASLFHGASSLATARVDGLLGLDEETDKSQVKVDQKWLCIHLAGLGSPKSSSVCWLLNAARLTTLRFLRATPEQYGPFRGISSSKVQKVMRELEGYKLLSALKSMALSPNLLWDMLLPWALQRDGSDYEVNRGAPLQLEIEQDLMVAPTRQSCLLEEYEWDTKPLDEVISSIKKRNASPAIGPIQLGKRKRGFLGDTPMRSAGVQRLRQKLRKIQNGDAVVVQERGSYG